EAVPAAPGDVQVGDHVAVASLGGANARVLEVRGDALVVLAGAVRTTVPRSGVRRASRPRAAARDRGDGVGAGTAAGVPRATVPIGGDVPELRARPEVDLRGLRIGELDGALMHALDEAVRADLPTLRIIHGKGTGALRERVGELLDGDPRVRSHRLGAWNEGGAGVTVADLT
ncbi:MAG TPA: Smr/MutS family protein, partial [Gemmatimonadaceae bacterium]|nr:Smr/MutS family protein [Gemmatimonadaceae bacterium]